MNLKIALIALASSALASAAAAQGPPGPPNPGEPAAGLQGQAQVEQGNKAFQYYCAPCHGSGKGSGRPFLPGTDGLNVKYKGERPALLEERTDLTPEFVSFAVRNGIEGMPSFRKVELSDANLAAIGAYLTRNNK